MLSLVLIVQCMDTDLSSEILIVIHRLNNWGLRYNFVYRNKNSQVDKKMKDNLIGKKAIIEVA